ncbi:hypothetical protein [Telluribacter sp.]|jgi:dipeptidyl aminopeptidase/acylaminoacyl peptidase|uniref:TolB family protein n=1 Tax=Telluribacter sp. TaxID=1978767 RepID=UPI002E12D764|nr:hypothetical protein [Telluribacter sp.]
MRYLCLFSLYIFGCQSTPSFTPTYAAQRGEEVGTFRAKSREFTPLARGMDPCLSPDGTRLAYTENRPNGDRGIRVINLKTKESVLLNVEGKNYYGPVWSPDNSRIAFSIFEKDRWHIGVISKDNQDFRIISTGSTTDLFAPTWTFDGKKLVVHDLEQVYLYDLNGRIVKKYPAQQLAKDFSLSSSSHFILSPDEQYFLFNAGVAEGDSTLLPMEAIFSYDLQTDLTTRLTPPGLFSSDPYLHPEGELYFSGSEKEDAPLNAYQMNIQTRQLTELLKNASRPTCSFNK